MNTVTVTRAYKDRTLTVRGAYSEETDDWNLIIFDGGRALDVRASTNIWVDIRDMLECAFLVSSDE